MVIFGAVLAAGFEPAYLRALFGDRSVHVRIPDRRTPEYPRFLEAVAERVERGHSVSIAVPFRHWDGGYSYAYYRASYFLPGRRVVPIIAPDDRLHLERLKETQWVAAWRMPEIPGYDVVWRGHGGALLRRAR